MNFVITSSEYASRMVITIGIILLNVVFGLFVGISVSFFLDITMVVITIMGTVNGFVFLGSVFVTDAV